MAVMRCLSTTSVSSEAWSSTLPLLSKPESFIAAVGIWRPLEVVSFTNFIVSLLHIKIKQIQLDRGPFPLMQVVVGDEQLGKLAVGVIPLADVVQPGHRLDLDAGGVVQLPDKGIIIIRQQEFPPEWTSEHPADGCGLSL